MKNIKCPQGDIPIIYEDDDVLVINKPAGMIVHESENTEDKTLADYIVTARPEVIAVGEDSRRPGIVHRLDREASGLMVIAKNNQSFKNLKNQFKTRKIKKQYLALAYGKIIADEGLINFPIVRAKAGHKMAAIPLKMRDDKSFLSNRDQGNIIAREKSREAITNFEVIKRWPHYTLLEVKIKTGRTHQIRVHLAAYGHPLLGDNLYGTTKTKVKNSKVNLGRIFLLAQKLSFTSLNKEKMEFEIQLPLELKSFLDNLK
ncbi:MAG: RluA family pseudouridine synthase [Patescibacteria group bacterium]|nr:RluA family pseudouridine synthase [Patescibacteria group bacterium]